MAGGWSTLLAEARASRGGEFYPLRAYSEFMPPPRLGVKPYGEVDPFTRTDGDDYGWNVSEHEWIFELDPGLERIANHLLEQLSKLGNGHTPQLPQSLLADNPAWPKALAERAGSLPHKEISLLLPLALSKTQDDKGRVLWTLFGASHEGPAQGFWKSFYDAPGHERPAALDWFRTFVAFAAGAHQGSFWDLRAAGVRVLPIGEDPQFPSWEREDLPSFVRRIILGEAEPAADVRILLTFRPFERIPQALQRAYLSGHLKIVPFPGSLVFWYHSGFRKLAVQRGRDARAPGHASGNPMHAIQIPLLHLFPRSSVRDAIRIPQSGWLDEIPDDEQVVRGRRQHGHRLHRTHRWQRVTPEDEDFGGALLDDPATIALFSADADEIDLYGKPMARNSQIWTEQYERVLDGPKAGRKELVEAARRCHQGGRFGYRLLYPAMRVGPREVFWHIPLIARSLHEVAEVRPSPFLGHLTAEREGADPIELWPLHFDRTKEGVVNLLLQPYHAEHREHANCRKLLEWRVLMGHPLPRGLARALVHAPKEQDLGAWLARLPEPLSLFLGERIGPDADVGPSITFEHTHAREFEERYWQTIHSLSAGEYREKNNADVATSNEGRSGGMRAKEIGREVARERQLDQLAQHLHRHYGAVIAHHGMSGRALCADHVFRWECDFEFPWMGGWKRNENGELSERNVVVVIPGRDRREAIIMADHYDTAYMEDLYDPERGGDRCRVAAAGADDNHSATAALMLAAEVLLPLSREGKLARDVWLVHLTGEEFPADCLGARALASQLVAGGLALTAHDGARIDLSRTRVRGTYVLDMIAHNRDHDRDVFQIAPGEGRGSARLAWHAWKANARWNALVREWNSSPDRKGRGRGARGAKGPSPPPVAEHLALHGEVRPKWDPRSALYNTDGQVFSDAGVPVVLFMENYDISRSGYHDTHDTMENIDLDYGAALAAIAIEAVAEAATEAGA